MVKVIEYIHNTKYLVLKITPLVTVFKVFLLFRNRYVSGNFPLLYAVPIKSREYSKNKTDCTVLTLYILDTSAENCGKRYRDSGPDC